MAIPKILLSDYYKKVEKGEIKPEISPFEVSLIFSPGTRIVHNQGQLDLILRDFLKDFFMELEDRVLTIHFWDKVRLIYYYFLINFFLLFSSKIR